MWRFLGGAGKWLVEGDEVGAEGGGVNDDGCHRGPP